MKWVLQHMEKSIFVINLKNIIVTLEIHWLTREPAFSLVLYTSDHSTLVNMNVSKFYGRTKN